MSLEFLNIPTSPQLVAHRANIWMARKLTIAVNQATNWWEYQWLSAKTESGHHLSSVANVIT